MLVPHILGSALAAPCMMPTIVRQSSRTCASAIAFRKSATEASLILVLGSAIYSSVRNTLSQTASAKSILRRHFRGESNLTVRSAGPRCPA